MTSAVCGGRASLVVDGHRSTDLTTFLPSRQLETMSELATHLNTRFGLSLKRKLEHGELWTTLDASLAVILDDDTTVLPSEPYFYVNYTTEQNSLMHAFPRLLRFLIREEQDEQDIIAQLSVFMENSSDEDSLRRFGGNRSDDNIDPTQPEAVFENEFSEVFGTSSLYALEREYPIMDVRNTTRYIDYLLHTSVGRIAIELNGESFHHPAVIGAARYRSQLLKQNSLVASGIKVFRWSLRGMDEKERFHDEMRLFFGDSKDFSSSPFLRASRSVGFKLMEHQDKAVAEIQTMRASGRTAALLVLPTGTGKTEIAIGDFRDWKSGEHSNATGLYVVPTDHLRTQVLARLAQRLSTLTHSREYVSRGSCAGFMVQTAAYMNLRYDSFSPDAFDYIVIDEAHHAVAPGYLRFIRHFNPAFLLGLTATPERLDQRRIEEVFGEYQTHLSLQDAISRELIPPVRAFRLRSNIDLSSVRFNGVDYTPKDLQTAVVVQSRDELIVSTVKRYFSGDGLQRSGIVFCVNVDHSKRMAKLLSAAGMKAAAVSGRDRTEAQRTIADYHDGKVQFLCSCALINEGFDAPHTSVVVMARPTMSKALYVQQLGRGTRKWPGKEALYVIDVVDQHGPLNAPWTVHALLGQSTYLPWAEVIDAPEANRSEEIPVPSEFARI